MTKYIIVTYYKIQNAVFLIPKYTYNTSKYGKNNSIPLNFKLRNPNVLFYYTLSLQVKLIIK